MLLLLITAAHSVAANDITRTQQLHTYRWGEKEAWRQSLFKSDDLG